MIYAILYIVALIAGTVIGVEQGRIWCNKDWHKKLVERGFAEYDSKTGEWRWKEVDGR